MKKKPKLVRRNADRDNPEWTAADFRRAHPVAEVLPEIIVAADAPSHDAHTARPSAMSAGSRAKPQLE